MIIEQILFITIAFFLFVYMFYQLIKKNDTRYVTILAIQALGIAIKFVEVCFGKSETNVTSMIITYILSIIIPVVIIIIEKINGNMSEIIEVNLARLYLLFGNTKSAKKILIQLVTQYPESYMKKKVVKEKLLRNMRKLLI